MGYDTIVCVKQVPDTANITVDAMKPDGTVNRAALPAIFNPEDLHALEAALELRDRFGGTVTRDCDGPGRRVRSASRCACTAVLIAGSSSMTAAPAASDTLATSYILSQAVRKIGRYDIVFCGRQAIDGDTAQVGPQMAEKLGIPQVTYFEKLVELSGNTIRVRRNVGNGWEILEGKLPVLVTVLDTANEPRPAAAKRVMRFKRSKAPGEITMQVGKEMPQASDAQKQAEIGKRMEAVQMSKLVIEQWDLDDLKADLQWCGLAGSPTKVHRVQSIVPDQGRLYLGATHGRRRVEDDSRADRRSYAWLRKTNHGGTEDTEAPPNCKYLLRASVPPWFN